MGRGFRVRNRVHRQMCGLGVTCPRRAFLPWRGQETHSAAPEFGNCVACPRNSPESHSAASRLLGTRFGARPPSGPMSRDAAGTSACATWGTDRREW
jgi:hypothetical protein